MSNENRIARGKIKFDDCSVARISKEVFAIKTIVLPP